MTAISDASDITIWPWRVWIVLAAIALLALAFANLDRIPEMPAQPSTWDGLDGVGRCGQRGCTGNHHVTAYDTAGAPHDLCISCFSAGTRKGYWTVFATKDAS